MSEITAITNRVANSKLISVDLEDFLPREEIMVFQVGDFLYQGLILKEKEFRKAIKDHDWSQYEDRVVAIVSTEDAIIPTWAFMLVASKLVGNAAFFAFGSKEEVKNLFVLDGLRTFAKEQDDGGKYVVKGCGEIREAVYVEVMRLLQGKASSIMYGEPCSSVPVFKKPLKK